MCGCGAVVVGLRVGSTSTWPGPAGGTRHEALSPLGGVHGARWRVRGVVSGDEVRERVLQYERGGSVVEVNVTGG